MAVCGSCGCDVTPGGGWRGGEPGNPKDLGRAGRPTSQPVGRPAGQGREGEVEEGGRWLLLLLEEEEEDGTTLF